MALDLSKLENVKQTDKKTIARCPACAEEGADTKGDHLFIRPDGRFGCVLYPGISGRNHRKRITALAGNLSRGDERKIPLQPAERPKIEILGRVGRVNQTHAHMRTAVSPESDALCIRTHNKASDPSGGSPEPRSRRLPDLTPLIRSLEVGDPEFEEPPNDSLILGLYREDDGTVVPVLLWADPKIDFFWDIARKEHVRPPRYFLTVAPPPCPFDPKSGPQIIDGIVCPF